MGLHRGLTHLLDSITGQCSRQVLLVGKDEEGCSSQALGKEKMGWGWGRLNIQLDPFYTRHEVGGQHTGSGTELQVVGEVQVGGSGQRTMVISLF